MNPFRDSSPILQLQDTHALILNSEILNGNQDEKCVLFIDKLTEALRNKQIDAQSTFYDLLHMFEQVY